MSEAEYGLVRSFGIDNGELDEFEKHECFVLGYELAIVDGMAMSGLPFSITVHLANKQRIESRLAGRRYTWGYMHDDESESWVLLDVWSK